MSISVKQLGLVDRFNGVDIKEPNKHFIKLHETTAQALTTLEEHQHVQDKMGLHWSHANQIYHLLSSN